MPPARKRGAKGTKTKNELSLGDLVLAKVKGFPAWPAKISRPEDWKRVPDPKKYFVQFFGTSEIAFVAPADIQAFNIEAKNKLSARCQGKTVKYFAQAVKEICEQYEKLHHESSSGTRVDNSEQTFASELSADPVVNDNLEVSEKVGIEINESLYKSEINGLGELGSRLEHGSQRQGEVECQGIKPYLSGEVDRTLPPCVSLGKVNKLSKDLTNLPSNVKKEASDNVKVESRQSDSGRSELENGHQKKLGMGSKKLEGTVYKNSSSTVPHEQTGDRMQRKSSSDSITKVSSVGNSKSVSAVGKEKRIAVDKTHFDSKDNGWVNAEMNLEQSEVISRKRMKTLHGSEKQASQTILTTCPAKIKKCTDIGNDDSMSRSQRNRKIDSKIPSVLHEKMTDIELKKSTSDGIPQNQQPSRIQINNESNYFTNEDDLRAIKRHHRASEAMPSNSTASESKLGGSASHKNDSVRSNKVRSPVTQLPSKRRAVRLCDDEDEEIHRTPVHGGFTSKVSVTSSAPDSKKKSIVYGDSCISYRTFSRDKGTTDSHSKECARLSNKTPSPNLQLGLVKMAGELSVVHVSPSLSHLDDEKLPSMEIRPVSVTPQKSPQSITGARPLAEQQNINFSKEHGDVYQKKVPAGANKVLTTAFDRLTSSPHEVRTDRSNLASSREKKNATVKSDSRINDSSLMVGHPNKNIAALCERLDVGKHDDTSSSINAKISESAMSMKHLIAAAQARKREAHLQSSYGFLFPLLDNEAELHRKSPSPTPATMVFESSYTQQLDIQGLCSISPSADVLRLSSANQHENEVLDERMWSSGDHAIGGPLSGGTEAAVARDAFEGMIETLSRTKESIGRATRLAIVCAKYGIANEVVELLIHKLENEPSLHHRVDLFFLVDSITQCSHSQKGIAGSSYIPTVRAALDRLVGAAAPPGAGAGENRRQVRKVLRLWIERKILPESVLRRYVDDIVVANDDTSSGISLRRPSRAERAIDDPLREMEGMFVDEYGSNATFNLPGLLSSRVFEEEEEEEDSLSIDICKGVTDTSPSEHSPVIRDPENCAITPCDKRHRILEDVDGELEMEDVSGHQKDEKPLINDGNFEVASLEPNSNVIFTSASNKLAEWLPSPEGSPPLPPGSPPVTPPLPTSPPPSSPRPPPLPPLPLSTTLPPPPPPPLSQQQLFPPLPIGPPPVLCHLSLPPQPALMSQHMPSLPSSISTSSTLAFQPPPVSHEIGGTLTGNQHTHMVSSTRGFHTDASVRSEALSQQSSSFPPAGVGKAVEHISYNSSRTMEYEQCDAYMNLQSSQHSQLPGNAPFTHRSSHPEPPTQHLPTHFSYPKASVQQHQYPPYLMPNFSDGSGRYAADESWRMQVNEFSDSSHVGWMSAGRPCSGPPYPCEGYFEPPQERPPINAVNFQPPAPNSVAAGTQISVHGAQLIPGRRDMSAVSWRRPA